MSNYIVDYDLPNFEKIEIKDIGSISNQDNNLIVVVRDTLNFSDIYTGIKSYLSNNAGNIYLIFRQEIKGNMKAICSLLALYGIYNIYIIEKDDVITVEYIEKLFKRKPSLSEVITYISPEIGSYADLSVIINGIQTLSNNGDIEALKSFIEENIESIDSSVNMIEYLKKVLDLSNNGELERNIDTLREEIINLKSSVDSLNKECSTKDDKIESLLSSSEELKRKITVLEYEKSVMENNNSNNAPVIYSYNEINTALIKCKVPIIIYIKEISYVQYVNTLINTIIEILHIKEKKTKLVIYDLRTGINQIYKPLNVISGGDFINEKNNYMNYRDSFVVCEPNPIIIKTILESMSPTFDVVIIYDRMRNSKDVVTGNNVFKFWVINSSSDYEKSKDLLKISNKASIITRVNSSIGEETLNIPTIEGFNGLTVSAKLSRYNGLKTSGRHSVELINTIFKKAKIGDMYG